MIKNPVLLPIVKGVKGFAHLFGLDVVRHNAYHSGDMLLKQALAHFQIRTILDCGANTGQYAREVIKHGFKGEIHSFEAIPEVFNKLIHNASKYPQWKAYNLGIGEAPGEMVINVSENLVSSSILKVSEVSLSAEPKTRTTHQETIKMTTIDSFRQQHPGLSGNLLLKLDIQGYELHALKGAAKGLSSIKLVQTELSFTKLYENGPLFNEVTNFLLQNDFEVFAIVPGFRDDHSGRMLQADGIFVKKEA